MTWHNTVSRSLPLQENFHLCSGNYTFQSKLKRSIFMQIAMTDDQAWNIHLVNTRLVPKLTHPPTHQVIFFSGFVYPLNFVYVRLERLNIRLTNPLGLTCLVSFKWTRKIQVDSVARPGLYHQFQLKCKVVGLTRLTPNDRFTWLVPSNEHTVFDTR